MILNVSMNVICCIVENDLNLTNNDIFSCSIHLTPFCLSVYTHILFSLTFRWRIGESFKSNMVLLLVISVCFFFLHHHMYTLTFSKMQLVQMDLQLYTSILYIEWTCSAIANAAAAAVL